MDGSAGRCATYPSLCKEVVPMDYVTWPDLFEFVCVIVEIITLVVMIYDLTRK